MRYSFRFSLLPALAVIVSIACNAPAQSGSRTLATLNAEATAIPATQAANATAAANVTDAPTEAATTEPTTQPQVTAPPFPTQTDTLMYYAFTTTPAEGSVKIMDQMYLTPHLTDLPRDDFLELRNVGDSLEAMFADPNNVWTGTDMSRGELDNTNGAATIMLNGQITGAGDIVLIAARWQILLTIFAEPTIDSAVVLLNGENIANLGISHSSEAKPADYAYTRAEIDAFRAENGVTVP